MSRLIFVDVEAGPAPGQLPGLREFGAVDYLTRESFHGWGNDRETFVAFDDWIRKVSSGDYPQFVSDNPAFDWQWINYYFWKHLGRNPFGHSARRIGDFYAGIRGNFRETQEWKKLRRTKHDHNPVNDAMGNVEAFEVLLSRLSPAAAPAHSVDRVHSTTRRAIQETLAEAGFKGILDDLLEDNARFAAALSRIHDNKCCDDACGAIAAASLAGIDPDYEAARAAMP